MEEVNYILRDFQLSEPFHLHLNCIQEEAGGELGMQHYRTVSLTWLCKISGQEIIHF